MIDIEHLDRTAIIWLARGGARNAISVDGWRVLKEAAEALKGSEARACILASKDERAFSAGADIREFDAMTREAALAEAFLNAMRGAMEAVAALPMPVITAVDGGCYGAAVALALTADLIVAGDKAKFATTPAKLGLLYPQQDIDRLIARVGPGGAAHMLLTGAPVTADEALRMRLIELRAEDALAEAKDLAEQIAANAPGAVQGLKSQIRGWSRATARQDFLGRFQSAEFAERLAGFK